MMNLKKKTKILTLNEYLIKNNNIKLIFTVLNFEFSQKMTMLN